VNISAFCIKRPVFAIVLSLVMTIVGILGFVNLPVRWIPNITPPTVSISTAYPGASARLVEKEITKEIESSLSGISGIESIRSNSSQGSSNISITFRLGRNMDAAVEDIRSNLEGIRDTLPKDVRSPVVYKSDANSDPIVYVSFSDSTRNAIELSDYIEKFIMPSFETADGVGQVYMYGKRRSVIRISLDPVKMAGSNVTVEEVAQLLQEQNASIPTGQIKGRDRNYTIVTDTALKSIDQFNNLIIRDKANQVVRLKDIGEAKLEAESTDSAFRINGQPGIALAIVPQSNANPLDVEVQTKRVLEEVRRTLPQGMKAELSYNQADYIRASIHSVYESFIEAVFFVWLVILAFLCSFRATLIPIITIPVCIISTFVVLYMFGFSINTISLMAFVLAIGLVVDDAIVMLENISRHIENGMTPFNAAIKGSREILFPIIAMTLTLAAVYAPIAFTPGLLGVLFREFTFTLAGAVIISGFVALTLSPMMCSRLLKPQHKENGYAVWQGKKLQQLQQFYHRALNVILQKRKWVLIVLAVVALLGVFLYHQLPSELAPEEDTGIVFVSASGPRDASFQYSDRYARQLETIYQDMPDIESYLSIVGGQSASNTFDILILKPRAERKHSPSEIAAMLTPSLKAVTGVNANAFAPPPSLVEYAGGSSSDNVGLVIMTSADYRKLQQVVQQMMTEIKKNPGFIYVDNRMKWESDQFQLAINRDRAADLRVPMNAITNTLSTLLAGRVVGKTDDTDVIVQMNQSAIADPNIFQQMYVRNQDMVMTPLASLLEVNHNTAPDTFPHYERMRSDTIHLTLAPNYMMSDVVKFLQKTAKENLPDDMKFTFSGAARSFMASSGSAAFTFMLALLFIYLVLAAQFESFIDPLIIMLTVPFAVIGAIVALILFGGSLNIYSNIGLITLIGLIAKHGILITDFANRLRAEGKSVHDAIMQSALYRLRPILMTTAAMVLGAMPLAFAHGPGAESRQQIGLVIVGGLLVGTFFSLVVIPVVYSYLAPFRKIVPTEGHEYAHAL
jgi:multidrug efflux pump